LGFLPVTIDIVEKAKRMSTSTQLYYHDEEICVPELKRVHERDEVSCEAVERS
jgi:hypothetical protein